MTCVNDPHVETLTYEFRVVTGGHHFANANAWCGRLGDFDCVLENATLTARTTAHYATAAEARDALEPLLRGWEAQIELERAYQAEFNFASATVVDRNPPLGGQTRELQATVTGRATISADVSVEHDDYPSPPEDRLTESEILKELRERIRDFRTRRERVLVAAYWCLTRIERQYGSRQAAVRALNVSRNVLDEVGRIAAVNDPHEGRKFDGTVRQLTTEESNWIRNALVAVALRVGQVEAGQDPSGLPVLTRAQIQS